MTAVWFHAEDLKSGFRHRFILVKLPEQRRRTAVLRIVAVSVRPYTEPGRLKYCAADAVETQFQDDIEVFRSNGREVLEAKGLDQPFADRHDLENLAPVETIGDVHGCKGVNRFFVKGVVELLV